MTDRHILSQAETRRPGRGRQAQRFGTPDCYVLLKTVQGSIGSPADSVIRLNDARLVVYVTV